MLVLRELSNTFLRNTEKLPRHKYSMESQITFTHGPLIHMDSERNLLCTLVGGKNISILQIRLKNIVIITLST